MKSIEKLTLAAAEVAGRAAGSWDEFLVALRAYKDEQLTLMAQAPPVMVQQLQGRAQTAIDLLNKLETCREEAKKIMEKKNAQR